MIPHPYLLGAGVLGLGAWYLLKPKTAPAAPPWTPPAYAPPVQDIFAPVDPGPQYAPYYPTDPKYEPRVTQNAEPAYVPAYAAEPEYVGPGAGTWDESPEEEPADDWADPSAWFSGRRHGMNLLAEARKAFGR